MTPSDNFFNAGTIVLWIIIGSVALSVLVTVGCYVFVGILSICGHLKEKKRQEKLKKGCNKGPNHEPCDQEKRKTEGLKQ